MDDPLFDAIKKHKFHLLVRLLSKHKDTLILDKNKNTLLHIAVKYNFISGIKYLIFHGVPLDFQNSLGYTALHIAVIMNNFTIAEYLISQGINANIVDVINGRTCLHYSVSKNNLDMVRLLGSHMEDLCIKDNRGYSPLQLAVKKSYVNIIKYLMTNVSQIEDNILHTAVKTNNVGLVYKLLRSDININVLDKNGNTPIHLAVKKGNMNIVQALINTDRNLVNYKSDSPLHLAVRYHHIDIVKYLILIQYDLNGMNIDGNTPLHIAVINNFYEIAELLIKAGSKLNTMNKIQQTPLHDAVLRNNIEMVRLLLNGGAEINKADYNGWTSLHTAVSRNYVKLVYYLISMGADINAITIFYVTPLHSACMTGNLDLVKYLVSLGVSIYEPSNKELDVLISMIRYDSKDISNGYKKVDFTKRLNPTIYSPYHISAFYGQWHILKYLLEL